MGQFCLLLRHFLRKLKDACLFKAVLCQKTWNLLGLMDKKRNIFVLKRVKSTHIILQVIQDLKTDVYV